MKKVYKQPSMIVKTFIPEDVLTMSGETNSWLGEFTADPYEMKDFVDTF